MNKTSHPWLLLAQCCVVVAVVVIAVVAAAAVCFSVTLWSCHTSLSGAAWQEVELAGHVTRRLKVVLFDWLGLASYSNTAAGCRISRILLMTPMITLV